MFITLTCIDPISARPTSRTLTLPEGALVRDALAAAGLPHDTPCAVFARRVSADDVLHPGDRLDVGAPLHVDPMTARRLRAQHKAGNTQPVPRHGSRHQLIKPLEI